MDEVIIKALNQSYVVKCRIQDFLSFQTILKQKLQTCAACKQDHFDAFFDINKDLNDEELLTLFDICRESNTTILGFMNDHVSTGVQVYHGQIHGGQKYFFEGPTLLIGSIPKDAYVSSYDSLYVLGEVSGNIDLFGKDAILSASSLACCFIRIYDTSFQNVTNFAPSRVYYNNQTLICRELKEEVVWDNQSL